MINKERDFIEAAVTAVREAKELVLPVLMVDSADDPWNADRLYGLKDRDDLAPVVLEAVDLLIDFEAPFLEEEARLEQQGITLASDLPAFEVAMVDFERGFWQARFETYRADPERWDLQPPENFDVCEEHRLTSADVRDAIVKHGLTSFDDLAPHLRTTTECSTCHTSVTRLLLQELKRRKRQGEAVN